MPKKPKITHLRGSSTPDIPRECDPLFTVSSVASVTDCTCIEPTPALNPEEADSIDNLSNNPVPASDAKDEIKPPARSPLGGV